MLRKEIEDILHYISNNLPINGILPSKILQSNNRNIIDTCHDITTLSMLIALSPDILKALEKDKGMRRESKDRARIDFLVLSQLARIRQAELVYERLRDKTNKKSIVKEIKDGFDEVGYPKSATNAKLYVKSVEECLLQVFLPISVNALRYDNYKGFQDLLIISFSEKMINEERFDFQFAKHDAFKIPAINAFKSVKNIFPDEQSKILENLKITVRLRDFAGAYIDDGYDESADSIGLAMAIAIYFNFHLYCTSAERREGMRRLFEKELKNVAFTGEIKDGGEIGSVGGISRKMEAAENMEMKRVFCPAANEDKIKSESLSLVPVKSLEQTVIFLRYGQYLERIREEDKSKLPLIKERGFDEIVKKSPFDLMTSIEEDTKNPIKQVDVLKRLDKGILLVGDGGIGKSTFLKYLRWHYSNRILDGESIDEFKGSIKIPVFIDLRSYDSEKNIPELLRDSIIKECEDYDYLNPSDIEDELKAGGFLILCDGIDGIDRDALDDAEDKLQDLRNKYPKNYFIFTSRESTYLGFIPNLQQVELRELTRDDIETIIDKEFERDSEKGSELKALLEKNPLEIEGNPFFLSLIIEDVKNYSDMEIDISRFRNIGKLFERIVCGRYEKDSEGNLISPTSKDLDLIDAFKEFMPGFAAYLWTKGKKSFTENDIKLYSKRVKKKPAIFMECLKNPKLIPLLELISKGHWGFIHNRFFEYLAGVHLRDEFLKIVSETGMKPTPTLVDYLQEYINMMKWEDIVFNTIGLLVDCEVEEGKIYCKCNQNGFFCIIPSMTHSPCEQFSIIQDTYQLSRK